MRQARARCRPPATVVLAGPTRSGKSTLARHLSAELQWPVVSARHAIELAHGRAPIARHDLVRVGLQLELDNPGLWLVQATDRVAGAGNPAIVDAARTHAQIQAFRERLPRPLIVHIWADRDTREQRFKQQRARDENMSFARLARSRAEVEAGGLIDAADFRIDTTNSSSETVARKVGLWLCSVTRADTPEA
jgi:dephospho-CoA kinase